MNLPWNSISPEKYETHLVGKLPEDVRDKLLMSQEERYFVNGLVRLCKPSHILEIGVYRGGCTCMLLNALHDLPNSTVTSIDIATASRVNHAEKAEIVDVADMALKYHADNPAWELYAGEDPSFVIEKTGKHFDFLVLDTAHIHPIETLNFLTVFPFLTTDAVVVIHDINLHLYEDRQKHVFPKTSLACKLLFDTVKAEKVTPAWDSEYPPNIGAFQINEDTKRHIGDVISMLTFPWGTYLPNMSGVFRIVEKYYTKEQYRVFSKAAYIFNPLSVISGNPAFIERMKISAARIFDAERFILYGGGKNATYFIDALIKAGKRLPDEIWDANAKEGQQIDGISVIRPEFDEINDHVGLICTIGNLEIANSIFEKCHQKAFSNYGGLEILFGCSDDVAKFLYEIHIVFSHEYIQRVKALAEVSSI